MRTVHSLAMAMVLTGVVLPRNASAWNRGHVRTFAVLPDGASGPEGLEVDPSGNVYVGTFGFTHEGSAAGTGHIYVFDREGRMVRDVSVSGSSPHLLGLHWRASTGTLLVADYGASQVLEVNPLTGDSTQLASIPGAGLNDITEDRAGNVYVSDSTNGTVWKIASGSTGATSWISSPLLAPTGVPPFGGNGLRFNHAETALFVANTATDTIVKVPVDGSGAPGTPEVFVNSVNGADGLVVDADDNLWVVANQSDEIVVVDPSGRSVAKLGDFGGRLRDGAPVGLLFPASLRFAGQSLLVTNLSLDLRLFSPTYAAIDSPWCAAVTRYTVSALPARIPPPGGDGDP